MRSGSSPSLFRPLSAFRLPSQKLRYWKCKKEKQPLWWQEMILFPVSLTETETGRVSECYKANSRSELKRIIESPRIQSQHFFVLSRPLLSLSLSSLSKTFLLPHTQWLFLWLFSPFESIGFVILLFPHPLQIPFFFLSLFLWFSSKFFF